MHYFCIFGIIKVIFFGGDYMAEKKENNLVVKKKEENNPVVKKVDEFCYAVKDIKGSRKTAKGMLDTVLYPVYNAFCKLQEVYEEAEKRVKKGPFHSKSKKLISQMKNFIGMYKKKTFPNEKEKFSPEKAVEMASELKSSGLTRTSDKTKEGEEVSRWTQEAADSADMLCIITNKFLSKRNLGSLGFGKEALTMAVNKWNQWMTNTLDKIPENGYEKEAPKGAIDWFNGGCKEKIPWMDSKGELLTEESIGEGVLSCVEEDDDYKALIKEITELSLKWSELYKAWNESKAQIDDLIGKVKNLNVCNLMGLYKLTGEQISKIPEK